MHTFDAFLQHRSLRSTFLLPRRSREVSHDSSQAGVTGVETAIILIAFVVVASVFAYTVLSAGVFSSEKAKEATYAGLERTTSALVRAGSAYGESVPAVEIDNADDSWTAPDPNASASVETSDRKQGTGSVRIDVDAAFGTGIVARENVNPLSPDLSGNESVWLWLKVDADVAEGVVQIAFDDSSNCASPEEYVDLPALASSDGWERVQVTLPDPALLNDVACVALNATQDPGALSIWVDDVEAPAELHRIDVPVRSALDGGDVNLTTTVDSDADGLLSDEASPVHLLSASVSDTDELTQDVAWDVEFLGRNDGDVILEAGETAMVSVDLTGLPLVPVAGDDFMLRFIGVHGGTLEFEIDTPARFDTQMKLD